MELARQNRGVARHNRPSHRSQPYSVRQRPIPSCTPLIPSGTPPPMASRQRPGHPPEATGGLPGGSVDLHKILTMPPHGRPPVPPCPALGPALTGTVASRKIPIPSGKAQFHRRGKTLFRRESRRNAAGRPPVASGGWFGLSGGHGRRGARRYRGVARRCRALPARDRARKGWERWGHGGTGSPPVLRHRQNFTKALRGRRWPPEGGPASLEAIGGGVHDGIGARPPGGSESLRKI